MPDLSASNLLAIETATEACSAAAYCGGEISSRFQLLPQGHSHAVLRMCDEVLTETGISIGDLDAIAFGCGPGSFTGLRIAASVAQGLAAGCGCGIIPVSTLAALAQSIQADHVLAALDARMGEIYSGFYQRGGDGLMRLAGEEKLGKPEHLNGSEGVDWTGAGSGFAAYSETLRSAVPGIVHTLPDANPDAESIVKLALQKFIRGEVLETADAVPVYLRDNVAKKTVNRE